MSIIRWPNVLFTALAQYIAAIKIFTPGIPWYEVLKDFKLHSIVFATAAIVAAGFIINSFYDLEKDLVNRPHKTLFDRVVSKASCLRTYIILNIIGLFFSALGSTKILIFFVLFSFALWFYSHKLQKIPLVREFSASLLSVASFFSIGFHYQFISWPVIALGVILMMILFNREVVKDFRHYEGDKVAGNQTLIFIIGITNSKVIHVAISVITLILLFIFNYLHKSTFTLIYSGLIVLPTLASIFFITGNNSNGPAIAHRCFKLMILFTILFLAFF
ncbi:MAG: hypothetical protein GC181_06355 [Bacteroidetes bacterium]|nr:hypothetical protein [Bacteroidota bacterium]